MFTGCLGGYSAIEGWNESDGSIQQSLPLGYPDQGECGVFLGVSDNVVWQMLKVLINSIEYFLQVWLTQSCGQRYLYVYPP